MRAGLVASGDPESGNHKFMAIVIGTDESIGGLARRIGPKPVHMSSIRSRDTKRDIIGKVTFDGRNLMGLCIRLEKKRTFAKLAGGPKQRRRFASNKKLSRTYHSLMWNQLSDHVGLFLSSHNCEAHRLDFQCDFDCRDFVNDRGWRHASHGQAHMLADILAGGNSHGLEPKGSTYIDLSGRLEAQMMRHFRQEPRIHINPRPIR